MNQCWVILRLRVHFLSSAGDTSWPLPSSSWFTRRFMSNAVETAALQLSQSAVYSVTLSFNRRNFIKFRIQELLHNAISAKLNLVRTWQHKLKLHIKVQIHNSREDDSGSAGHEIPHLLMGPNGSCLDKCPPLDPQPVESNPHPDALLCPNVSPFQPEALYALPVPPCMLHACSTNWNNCVTGNISIRTEHIAQCLHTWIFHVLFVLPIQRNMFKAMSVQHWIILHQCTYL